MPKYVEERDWMRPVPGAFGIARAGDDWEHRHRADAHFLDGTGGYERQLRIYIEEEYGYHDWLWTYPGTVDELIADWKMGKRPVCPTYHVRYFGPFNQLHVDRTWKGELDQISWRPLERGGGPPHYHPVLIETGAPVVCVWDRTSFDGVAHVHEEDDSHLFIGHYELYGLREIREVFHVLDALAAI